MSEICFLTIFQSSYQGVKVLFSKGDIPYYYYYFYYFIISTTYLFYYFLLSIYVGFKVLSPWMFMIWEHSV